MINILYDQQIFRKQNYGGISKYFMELISRANVTWGYRVINKRIYSGNIYLLKHGFSSFDKLQRLRKFRGKSFLERIIVKQEIKNIISVIKKGKFDVFHPTYYSPDFLDYFPADKPFVLTVHDMIHELYYDQQTRQKHFETCAKEILIPKAAHIVAVSECTKNDILTIFPDIDRNKITVVHHGAPSFKFTKNVPPHLNLPAKYILFVGLRDGYKNFIGFLENIGPYLIEHNLGLLCVGGGDFTDHELIIINELGLLNKVFHYKVNKDEELGVFYSQAVCFVFPSMYEGFGIPILEAFACNCPVVLNNIDCFKEIAGDAALYFEQQQPLSLSEQLNKLQDSNIKENLVIKGKERLKNFSWERSVEKHLKIYRSLI